MQNDLAFSERRIFIQAVPARKPQHFIWKLLAALCFAVGIAFGILTFAAIFAATVMPDMFLSGDCDFMSASFLCCMVSMLGLLLASLIVGDY